MKKKVLQNIPKTKPMYSAGSPKDEAVCSSEYAKEKGNMFFLSVMKMHVICYADNPQDGDTVFFRVLYGWRQYVPQNTLNIHAVCFQR